MNYLYASILESYKIIDKSFVVIEHPFETDDGTAYKITFSIDGDKIGSACVCTYKKKNDFLFNLEVKKSLRGKGYGTKIVKYMISKYGVRHLIVDKENEIAIKLYKKFNFKVSEDVNDKFVRMER